MNIPAIQSSFEMPLTEEDIKNAIAASISKSTGKAVNEVVLTIKNSIHGDYPHEGFTPASVTARVVFEPSSFTVK